jgi:hypothetical protein
MARRILPMATLPQMQSNMDSCFSRDRKLLVNMGYVCSASIERRWTSEVKILESETRKITA